MSICYWPNLCNKMGQCHTCELYERGKLPPEHPVPAIPVVVEWLPDRTSHPLSNSIFLLRKHTSCPCCGEMIVLAVFDFDSIRCFEHFFPIGEYINYREWSEGIEAYIEIRETDATVQ